MFTSMVRVELTNEVADVNKRLNALKTKVGEEKEEVNQVILQVENHMNTVDQSVGSLDTQVEILEEAQRGTHDLLVSMGNERRLLNVRMSTLRARCSILKSQEREARQDNKDMKNLLKAQTGVINSQTEVIRTLEAQVAELREMVLEA